MPALIYYGNACPGVFVADEPGKRLAFSHEPWSHHKSIQYFRKDVRALNLQIASLEMLTSSLM